MSEQKYSDILAQWLVDLGYTHCFFVAGGNIMHLLESCSHKLTCVPVVHEVAAGIAAEYFNEVHLGHKAFALVTAGPGMTNLVTALGGAWLESRELLVLGGQVKTADLNRGEVRQRGIQEIDGVAIAAPVCEKSLLMEKVVNRSTFADMTFSGRRGRKGPIFIEIPLDVQGAKVDTEKVTDAIPSSAPQFQSISPDVLSEIKAKLAAAKRPAILLGAGIDRDVTDPLQKEFADLGVPLFLTWNAMDRIGADHPMYFGRPNTWGQRYSNILLQQADLIIALGTRLSLQQTGFNWQAFAPVAEVIHVDCDEAELRKGHPRIDLSVCGDANAVLKSILTAKPGDISEWLGFCKEVKAAIPLVEEGINNTGDGFLSPYKFVEALGPLTSADDLVIPCSSGSAFTSMMQTFAQKFGQRIVTNKGLASMGYGLSGAIGAAFAGNGRRTILVEGDGGFIQNLQELGTAAANKLNLKIFIYDDRGYASIRMTQINYFGGRYVGCDTETGLGIPKWQHLFAAYDIPMMRVRPGYETDPVFLEAFNAPGVAAFMVHVDPKQTYFPKITSRVTASGSMESNPIHRMTPDLSPELESKVFRYLPEGK